MVNKLFPFRVTFAGDWDSSLLPSANKTKRRISLFSNEEQKRIKAARRMRGLPDLSAIMATELGFPNVEPSVPSNLLVASDASLVSLDHRKPSPGVAAAASKKKSKKRSRDASSVGDDLETLPEGGGCSETAEPSSKKKKKKKQLSLEGNIANREAEADRSSVPSIPTDGTSLNLALADEPRSVSPEVPLQKKRSKRTDGQGTTRRQAPSNPEASVPGSSTGGVPVVRKTLRVEFPDRVSFEYDGLTPIIYAPQRCAELVSQIKCGQKPFPPVADLIFKDEYVDSARTKLLVSLSLGSFISSVCVIYILCCLSILVFVSRRATGSRTSLLRNTTLR